MPLLHHAHCLAECALLSLASRNSCGGSPRQVTGGFSYVAVLFSVLLLAMVGFGVVQGWLEGTLTALALALSSTSVVGPPPW